MPPNFDIPPPIDHESFSNIEKQNPQSVDTAPSKNGNFTLEVFQSSLNLVAHILVGMVTCLSYFYALRGVPLTATPQHILFCVTGYQLLMSQAILSLSEKNGWSQNFNLTQRRRAHWILQLLGSGLAIVGSFIKIMDKTVHWTTLHGKFGLVALVFTTVSLVNGLASLYAYELRGKLPANLSKISHICFGTVAFMAANCCLCFAFDKNSFRTWSNRFADIGIGFTGILCFIVIIYPMITFVKRTKAALK